jgi:hypothetical protein
VTTNNISSRRNTGYIYYVLGSMNVSRHRSRLQHLFLSNLTCCLPPVMGIIWSLQRGYSVYCTNAHRLLLMKKLQTPGRMTNAAT